MAKRQPPEFVRSAIALHLLQAHRLLYDPSEIGRRTARRDAVKVTWKEADDEQGASFRCRRCPAGFDFYLVEVEAQVPSARILKLIRGHFRSSHNRRRELQGGAIYHRDNQVEDAEAIFLPMLAERGAGIICKRCPQLQNQILLTEPPYRDARRLRWLLQTRELWHEVASLPSSAQAEYLEALDRGLLQQRQHAEARQALRQKGRQQGSARNDFDRALQRVLRDEMKAGQRPTAVIKRLAKLSDEKPGQFARLIGLATPSLAAAAATSTPREFARRTAVHFEFVDRRFPKVGERRLWTLWSEIKQGGLL